MGGNVFKNADGSTATQRISRADVQPTVSWLEKILGMDLVPNMLGTAGKAATSGDIDIAVDEKNVTKDDLIAKLSAWAREQNEQPKDWIKKSGDSVHFKLPIMGDPSRGFVQADLMLGEPEWMKWSMRGGSEGSQFKGMHRHLLMASIAKAQGLKWSYKAGLTNRETGDLVSRDPDGIAKALLGDAASAADLEDVDSILTAIKQRPNYDQLVADFKDALSRDPKGPQLESVNMELGSADWFRFMMNRFS